MFNKIGLGGDGSDGMDWMVRNCTCNFRPVLFWLFSGTLSVLCIYGSLKQPTSTRQLGTLVVMQTGNWCGCGCAGALVMAWVALVYMPPEYWFPSDRQAGTALDGDWMYFPFSAFSGCFTTCVGNLGSHFFWRLTLCKTSTLSTLPLPCSTYSTYYILKYILLY